MPNIRPVIVGIDLASGPDITVLTMYDSIRQRIIDAFTIPKDFIMRDQAPKPQALSHDAANAIMRQVNEYDGLIREQKALRDNAMLTIVTTTDKINNAYEARKSLSDQLDKFAPEDFIERVDTAALAPDAPAYNTKAMGGYAPVAPWSGRRRPWHTEDPTLKLYRERAAKQGYDSLDGEL